MSTSAPRLSRRQIHVLAGAARGRTNGQIATALGVKRATVSRTLLLAGRVLGTGSRAGMVHLAYQAGILAGLTPEPRHVRRVSPAQRAVLDGLARGCSGPELAEEMCVSLNTVKTHVRRLFVALGANSRSHAVALGWQHGLLGARPEWHRSPVSLAYDLAERREQAALASGPDRMRRYGA